MHLVNILRVITFSCLERHSNFNNSDFNSFRFFWDTLYGFKFFLIHFFHFFGVFLLGDLQ
jgi:hypothetical protein